ncbi:MAG: SAM-dependent chlorinase/fluorinase [Candidatus Hydrothermarchaeota archaeon]|nr:SAM-dependent chlorinase/fluorinase [Candidatus Hydrothermarchaeota archaeon]
MIITLTTDFGDSEYVGAMKGVIYSICPKANVVDISHWVRKFDIRHAAYVVLSTTPYFPRGTIHCVVVDPGVGTERRGIIVKTKEHIYLGPDNGSFSFLTDIRKIIEIQQGSKSMTFHGRDVFAPIAAKLACGYEIEEFGEEIKDVKKLEIKKASKEGGAVVGEVLCIDAFGNAITNICSEILNLGIGETVKVTVGKKKLDARFLESYGFGDGEELIITVGSSGFLELAVNKGSASAVLGLKGGEKVVVR